MARIVLRHEGGETEFLIRGVVTVGRQATNDIPVLDEKASRHHARVTLSGSKFFIEDLGSSNGTLLNGNPVERHELKHGDVVRIGKARLLFYEDRSSHLDDRTIDNYRIHEKIGQGGMGTVYRATQISMDRTVAIKLLNEEFARDREFLDGFLKEARTAARLSHPNIVRVHDFGEAAGTYYFSMEFVGGEGLDAVLRRDGRIPIKRALEITRQVACALEHAHSQNIIHRDVKPQNILLASDGTAKLTDLGLAALSDHVVDGSGHEGEVHGTPDYMPPEIAEQRPVDSRADIYQLGATLFHMVTGHVPYEGPDAVAVIAKHVRDPIPSPKQYEASIPDSLCRLIETTMSKNPAMRPSPASVLIEKIDDILKREAGAIERASRPSGRPPTAASPPVSRPARSTRRRILRVPAGSPTTYALIGGLVVAIMAVVGLAMTGGGGSSRSAGPRTTSARRRGSRRSANSKAKPRRSRPRDVAAREAHDDAVLADPVTAAEAERNAAERLAEIKKQLAANPAAKTYAGRTLYRLINDYPQTAAAVEARGIYRDLFGKARERDLFTGSGQHKPGSRDDDARSDDALEPMEERDDFRDLRQDAGSDLDEVNGESRAPGNAGRKVDRFDFSHHEQVSSWKTGGDSRWAVRGGALVHEDSGIGSATLKTRTYRAEGCCIFFEVTFLESIGALEVELGSEGDSVWFSLGSSGYEARSSSGGEEAKARGEWQMQPEKFHSVTAVMTGRGLAVSVDGEDMPALRTSSLEDIAGHLTFRAQGVRLELDNVEVRQVR